MNKVTMPEPVAVVMPVYALHWAGSGPISPLIERNNIKIGDKLHTAAQMEAYAAARVREALEQAAQTCEARIGTGSPGIDTGDCDDEARECAAAIRNLIPPA